MISYLNGEYLEKENIRISPDDRGFLFADGLYEVVRFYNGKPFRIKEHQRRLENGAKVLRFNKHEFAEFSEVAFSLQAKNYLENIESSIMYFQATRGAAPRSHSFPAMKTPLTIYAYANEFKSKIDEQQKGAKAITVPDDRWANCYLKTIALLPNTMAHQLARDKNAMEALFIRDGIVQEGTHCNICIFFEGKLITPPLSKFILSGVTRKAVLELCDDMSIHYLEKPIPVNDLYLADEVFLVGTTVEITPIICIDNREIGDNRPGPVCRKLQNAYRELVRG